MPALKKISQSKNIVYILIIALMLGGAVYMLFLNNKKASPNAVQVKNNSLSGQTTNALNELKGNNIILTEEKPAQNFKDSQKEFKILENKKFKDLKDSSSYTEEKPEPGKRNPFLPD